MKRSAKVNCTTYMYTLNYTLSLYFHTIHYFSYSLLHTHAHVHTYSASGTHIMQTPFGIRSACTSCKLQGQVSTFQGNFYVSKIGRSILQDIKGVCIIKVSGHYFSRCLQGGFSLYVSCTYLQRSSFYSMIYSSYNNILVVQQLHGVVWYVTRQLHILLMRRWHRVR